MTGTAPIVQMASSQRGSVAAISPTKPRSGLVFFLRARKTWPSPPERPIAAWPMLAERGDQRLVDAAGEDHQGGVAGFGVGDAEAGDELAFFAHLREGAGELHAAAVNDGDLVAVVRRDRRWPCRRCAGCAVSSRAAPPSLTTNFIAGPPLRSSRTSGSCSGLPGRLRL